MRILFIFLRHCQGDSGVIRRAQSSSHFSQSLLVLPLVLPLSQTSKSSQRSIKNMDVCSCWESYFWIWLGSHAFSLPPSDWGINRGNRFFPGGHPPSAGRKSHADCGSSAILERSGEVEPSFAGRPANRHQTQGGGEREREIGARDESETCFTDTSSSLPSAARNSSTMLAK